MLAICPIDTHKRRELGLPIHFLFCHKLVYSTSLRIVQRLALLPRSPYSRLLLVLLQKVHLSVRSGSKARPAARDSDLKRQVFGDLTRSSGTPLLAVIVDSQQKTSSATICTPLRFLPQNNSLSCSPRETTLQSW